MFRPVESTVQFPALETEILKFWKEGRIYEKSLAARAGAKPFIFYEGPPTANGLPHPGHCLTRAIKDLFPRYKTMRGYRCDRKAGWDTHGLPVEVEVCKELGIHSKEEIEAFGIEPFIHKCQESVWRYMQEWNRLTERLGFWVDLNDAYVTYHRSYVESVWSILRYFFDRGLLYQGHKIVWWWAQGGTALSSGEVGQGYREVADPSVYVKLPLLDDAGKPTDTSLLVWTTTPWTLPSNQFAAVHPDLEYAVVLDVHDSRTERLIIAASLVEVIAGKIKRELRVERTLKGGDLIGRRYMPPFDFYYRRLGNVRGWLKGWTGSQKDESLLRHIAWRVVSAEFVTTESGTGLVHEAPAFGEVDFEVLRREKLCFAPKQATEDQHLDLICAVGPDGKFTSDAPPYQGRWVKDCDKDITRDLRSRGLLLLQEQYLHEYPFCWRAEEDPLIQYPRRSWFIRTSQWKAEMLANNSQINWFPDHIKNGRFGNFLETNVDWALSRERYWGTPLPIWVCPKCQQKEAVASYAELEQKKGFVPSAKWCLAKLANPNLSNDLIVHKPYIDDVTFACGTPDCSGTMERVTEVIDCWFDSGAMPIAQWGLRVPKSHLDRQEFIDGLEGRFPADFISEAIDQTRGWFYSLLAISTLSFGDYKPGIDEVVPKRAYPHPFKNCIVLGLMLGEDGQKMSKSKRNYREPNEIFDRYGADALRWYFFANQAPWTSIRYSEQAIKDSIPEFLLRLWHTYSFLVIYARIDGFDPATAIAGRAGQLTGDVLSRAKSYRPVGKRSELDRWILSELHRTAAAVTERMDQYDNFTACGHITAFVDALSNWWLRRSRDRFWSEDKQDTDKLDAYWTLYECLLAMTKIIAPFVPFLAEELWKNLAVAAFADRADAAVAESVHLCDFPTGDASVIDEQLSQHMSLVREIVSLGRNARMVANLKVRQPLAKVEIILADKTQQSWLEGHAPLIREELNVKQVEFVARADQYITYTVLPDLKKLGPKLGKRLPALKQALAKVDAAALLAQLETAGQVTLDLPDGPVALDSQDIQVRLQPKPGWAAAHSAAAVVVISTEITDELRAEAFAREVIHAVQNERKVKGCEYTDRIIIGYVTESETMRAAIEKFTDSIRQETLAVQLIAGPIEGVEGVEVQLGGESLTLYVKVK